MSIQEENLTPVRIFQPAGRINIGGVGRVCIFGAMVIN